MANKHEDGFEKTMAAVKREAVREEARAVIDFDAAQDEYKLQHEPHRVKFGGVEFDVPATIPYKLAQTILRHCLKQRNGEQYFEIPDDKIATVIQQMMGTEFAKAVEDSEVELSFVASTIIPKIMELWGIVEPPVKNGKTPAS